MKFRLKDMHGREFEYDGSKEDLEWLTSFSHFIKNRLLEVKDDKPIMKL